MAAAEPLPIPHFKSDAGSFYVMPMPMAGAAPITFAASLHKFHHAPDCRRSRETEGEGSSGGSSHNPLVDLAAADLACEVSAKHSVRSVCSCMDDFDLDKQGVLELASRELITRAFLQVLTMVNCYGVSEVLADGELLQIVSRYDFLSRFYEQKSEVSWVSTNLQRHAYLPPLQEAAYKKSELISDIIPEEQTWAGFCRTFRQLRMAGHHIDEFAFKTPYEIFVDYPRQIFTAMKWSSEHPKKAIIRLDTILKCDFESLLAIMSEVGMTETWVPYFKFPLRMGLHKAYTTAQLGRLDKVSMYKMDFPWPLKNRDCVIHGWIVDDLDHNDSFVISFRSVDKDYPISEILTPAIDVPPEEDKYCRIYVEGGCQITMLGPKELYLEMLWDIDLKAEVPISLIRFVGKTFVKAGLRSLANICKKVDSRESVEWEEAISSNRWLYGYMSERVKQHLKKKQLK